VEDEFSEVPYDPAETGKDGRMYPPSAFYRAKKRELADVRAYRQVSHITFIADNGAFEIREIDTKSVELWEHTRVEKPGIDGRRISDHGEP
jgi:hypothetical protein